jgi:hypothetical protein
MKIEALNHASGAQLWNETYRYSKSDFAALEKITLDLIAKGDAMAHTNGGAPIVRTDVQKGLLWAAKWVDGGCRIIEADAKYFAAMAQTKLSADASDDLRVPWPAFAVRLPPGLLIGEDGTEYGFAMLGQFDGVPDRRPGHPPLTNGAWIAISPADDSNATALWSYEPMGLSALLFAGTRDHSKDLESMAKTADDKGECASDTRIRELVKRAVVGLLYTMQHTTHWTHGSAFSKAGKQLRKEPPPHRSIVIGRPLSIDVTEAVRTDARSGDRSAPSVQTLVRGHIKRQVVGIGRAGRKVVWIEPYWRGPEGAPILARPYSVGPKSQ